MLEESTLHLIPYLRTSDVRLVIHIGAVFGSTYMLLDGGLGAAVVYSVGWLILGSLRTDLVRSSRRRLYGGTMLSRVIGSRNTIA